MEREEEGGGMTAKGNGLVFWKITVGEVWNGFVVSVVDAWNNVNIRESRSTWRTKEELLAHLTKVVEDYPGFDETVAAKYDAYIAAWQKNHDKQRPNQDRLTWLSTHPDVNEFMSELRREGMSEAQIHKASYYFGRKQGDF
jgi:hypothetical protein